MVGNLHEQTQRKHILRKCLRAPRIPSQSCVQSQSIKAGRGRCFLKYSNVSTHKKITRHIKTQKYSSRKQNKSPEIDPEETDFYELTDKELK